MALVFSVSNLADMPVHAVKVKAVKTLSPAAQLALLVRADINEAIAAITARDAAVQFTVSDQCAAYAVKAAELGIDKPRGYLKTLLGQHNVITDETGVYVLYESAERPGTYVMRRPTDGDSKAQEAAAKMIEDAEFSSAGNRIHVMARVFANGGKSGKILGPETKAQMEKINALVTTITGANASRARITEVRNWVADQGSYAEALAAHKASLKASNAA